MKSRLSAAWVIATQCFITVGELLRTGLQEVLVCLLTDRQTDVVPQNPVLMPACGHVAKPKP